ncbi:hypothetical protein H6504_04645 [Candidatus Woesearchaeota archaeon]|nr:hypothetical protein [Candidatus Woesearchaeota archaeon]
MVSYLQRYVIVAVLFVLISSPVIFLLGPLYIVFVGMLLIGIAYFFGQFISRLTCDFEPGPFAPGSNLTARIHYIIKKDMKIRKIVARVETFDTYEGNRALINRRTKYKQEYLIDPNPIPSHGKVTKEFTVRIPTLTEIESSHENDNNIIIGRGFKGVPPKKVKLVVEMKSDLQWTYFRSNRSIFVDWNAKQTTSSADRP